MATKLTKIITEGSTATYTATLKDKDGVVVPGSALSSLKLTLYEPLSGAIVNLRSNQNVLQQNNVTVSESGLITFDLQGADTAIVNTALNLETHRALWQFAWAAGAKKFNHVVDFLIENLAKLP